jgi:hypothetical protein
LLEIEAEIAIGNAHEIAFNIRGVPIIYDVANQKISCLGNQAVILPPDGKISLHLFVGRRSVDNFGAPEPIGHARGEHASTAKPQSQTVPQRCHRQHPQAEKCMN